MSTDDTNHVNEDDPMEGNVPYYDAQNAYDRAILDLSIEHLGGKAIPETKVEALLRQSTIATAKMGAKTCVAHVTLPNGFEITESAACVNPDDYNETIGRAIALDRIKDKVWMILGHNAHTNGDDA